MSEMDQAVNMNEVTLQPAETMQEIDPLDELKDLDLLLEDIEDKIAPLAL